MKILEANQTKDWAITLICDYCNSKIEVSGEDVGFDYINKFFNQNVKTYGIKCPCCNKFNAIPDKYIPINIKHNCKHISDIKNIVENNDISANFGINI